MKTVLLTTDSHHHCYFAEQVTRIHPWQRILVAPPAQEPPEDVVHPLDKLTDIFDRDILKLASNGSLASVAETIFLDSFSSPEFVTAIQRAAPDLAIVFGTDRLPPEVYSVAQVATLNLHGGDSESYRGLDTILWAIYHHDFDRIMVTMHHVNEVLDGGRIVFQDDLPIDRHTKLWHLRALRTMAYVNLAELALHSILMRGRLPSRRPRTLGRYYSHTPAVMKTICERKFNRHVTTL